MITRCPECATAFRVTYEQLEAREGRVRCGHCGEIFDAVAAMESMEEEGSGGYTGGGSDSELVQAPALEPEIADAPAETSAAASPPPASTTATGPMPASTSQEPSVPPRRKPDVEDEPTQIGFGRSNEQSRWWIAAVVVLLIVLSAQALFYFRGAIALVWPASKPYIQRFCAQLRCEVPLPRRAELMSIETSDLQAYPANPGVMVLSATLRNRAAFPQAYPALELTLTNERDEPLARRVLEPRDYLTGAAARERRADEGLPSCMGGVPSCELRVMVLFEAASLKASGYRLYLFYP
jgi:predicted Zn finger-like uncharacterized protein